MMLGLGAEVSAQDWLDYGGTITPAPVGANYMPLLTDITRGTVAIVGNVLARPTYETHTTPSGSSTIIRTGGSMNYPGGGAGPTAVPVTGVSTTTMLLLGAAAMVLLVMAKK